ncbi:hypothetical protein F5Y18DRAFT_217518 [Xylariaceae sp. FL1019]|nr:hypothetical protein F5Y18DRAFT_217518 [Xylariaceae sp. FL1019]
MDSLASLLLAFPPYKEVDLSSKEIYDNSLTLHKSRVFKLARERSKDLVTHCVQLFDLLDPAVNSLSYAVILHALLVPSLPSSVPRDYILEKLVTFLMAFDGRQCRVIGPILTEVINEMWHNTLLPPSVACEVLASYILRIDPTGTVFTNTHILLVKLAYQTNNIPPALPVIDKNIVFYPGMTKSDTPHPMLSDPLLSPPLYIDRASGFTPNIKTPAVLEYDLLCGLIYCTRRDWTKARIAFERVVSFPTKDGGTSKIMVEAYKKWVLTSLLSLGSQTDTAPYVSNATTKSYNVLARPYNALASAFSSDDVQGVKQVAAKYGPTWVEDANVGLVQELLSAYQKWRILSLQGIYTKISLAEIRQQTTSAETGRALPNDEEVERLLKNMISTGMLHGEIQQSSSGTKHLSFFPQSATLSEQEFAQELATTADNLKKLGEVFRATNTRLATSKEYVKWCVKEEKKNEQNAGAGMTYDEEDLMGGGIDPDL